MSLKLICVAALLLVAVVGTQAKWQQEPKGANWLRFFKGKFSLDVWTVHEPVYAHEKMVAPAAKPAAGTNSEAARSQMELHQLHPTSLAVRLSIHQNGRDSAVYSIYEGSVPKVDASALKLDNRGSITPEDVSTFTKEIEGFTHENTRLVQFVKNIARSLRYAVDFRPRSAKRNNALLEQMSIRFRSGKSAIKTATKAASARYEVHVYTGRAFGVAGHHSATRIILRNGDGSVVHQHDENNHGRGPQDNGIAFKCTHYGAEFDVAQSRVNGWSCVSPYWAFWCLRGPNHNCNANAQHQINIANNPTNPPAPEVDPICQTDCPILSPDCRPAAF